MCKKEGGWGSTGEQGKFLLGTPTGGNEWQITVSHTVAVGTHITAALPARTSVCLWTPGTWAGSVGLLWMGWSGRKSSSCWRTGRSGRNGRDWPGTGRRCGQTALSRRSNLSARAQTRRGDW